MNYKTLVKDANVFSNIAKETVLKNINVIAFTMDDALRYAKCNMGFL